MFYLFGLAPCHFSSENLELQACFRSAPVLVSILSSVCVALLQFFSFYLDSFGQISRFINYALYAVILCSNVTASWQTWYYKSIYPDIIHRVQQLETACKMRISVKMSYKSLKCWYAFKSTLLLACFSISAATVLGQAWFVGDESTRAITLATLTIFKEFMNALATLQFTLYVDILRLFVAELNKQMRWSPPCFLPATTIAYLTDVKSVHMDLFRLAQQINNFFGWHLVVLMIHYFILITYSFYWIFLTIQKEGEHYSIAGE